jgi:hypothetical protein
LAVNINVCWCLDTPLVEGVMGKQESMQDRLEQLVEKEFHARVLQPKSAQLRVEKITRKTIEVYLYAVQEELNKVQVEFQVQQQDWDRYLAGLPMTVMPLEASGHNLLRFPKWFTPPAVLGLDNCSNRYSVGGRCFV